MSCKYKKECPSYSGLCEASDIDYSKCIPFLITAHEIIAKELEAYKYLEKSGRFVKIPCEVGDPLYYIADEDDEGNEVPTVKKYDGGIRAIIITASGIRVADSVELSQIVDYSSEVGTRYAYLSPEDAKAAMKGAE